MITVFQAIILGIVEGVTEFLPISSTGHMILATEILGIHSTDFVKSFEIIIQLGAILAVVVLYWERLLMNVEIFKRVLAAFLPTAIIGYALYKVVKHYFLGNAELVLWSLLIGGILIILFERKHKESEFEGERIESISYVHAVIIGLFQAVAVIPGVSRAAATIIGGLLLGYRRQTIVEFSFMLAVPTMLAATVLDLSKNGRAIVEGGGLGILAVGFVVAFVVAFASVKWMLKFIKNHSFTGFGIYRIVASILGFFIIK